MKRLHVHVAVGDLDRSVRFYTTLFAVPPTIMEADYAKWMLDDPLVNFAVSARRNSRLGIEHLGIQVEDGDELAEVYARLGEADRPIVEERATTCCYARSDKQWITDPQGVAWETFLTHGSETTYGTDGPLAKLREHDPSGACCMDDAGSAVS